MAQDERSAVGGFECREGRFGRAEIADDQEVSVRARRRVVDQAELAILASASAPVIDELVPCGGHEPGDADLFTGDSTCNASHEYFLGEVLGRRSITDPAHEIRVHVKDGALVQSHEVVLRADGTPPPASRSLLQLSSGVVPFRRCASNFVVPVELPAAAVERVALNPENG